jgi:hypothetical protein
MSWDIFIQKFPDGAKRVADIPDTFAAPEMGSRGDVIEKICAAVPAVDFSDPAWGVLRTDRYSIEFGLGDEEKLHGVTLHVRGSDEVLPHVKSVIRALGMRAIDSVTGEFFDPKVARDSLAKWRSFVDEEG